jgi:hypothetical protein
MKNVFDRAFSLSVVQHLLFIIEWLKSQLSALKKLISVLVIKIEGSNL